MSDVYILKPMIRISTLCHKRSTRDRCFDLKNIFGEKFVEKLRFLLKLLLVLQKFDHNIVFFK
jgi:hypothetical protein